MDSRETLNLAKRRRVGVGAVADVGVGVGVSDGDGLREVRGERVVVG